MRLGASTNTVSMVILTTTSEHVLYTFTTQIVRVLGRYTIQL